LIAEPIALDQHHLDRTAHALERTVPGQHHPALSCRERDQPAPRELGTIEGIESEQAKPSGEAPEHPVDGESRRFHRRTASELSAFARPGKPAARAFGGYGPARKGWLSAGRGNGAGFGTAVAWSV